MDTAAVRLPQSFWKIMEQEIFKSVKGYEGVYEISNWGRLKSLPKRCRGHNTGETFLKLVLNKGYFRVNLLKHSVRQTVRIHVLVATYFCFHPKGCTVVNHLNTIKTDNYYKNLEWTTYGGNTRHAVLNGCWHPRKGEECYLSKLKEESVIKIRGLWEVGGLTKTEIGKSFKVHRQTVADIISRRLWKHI